MRVRVFRNLNKGCLSIIAREGACKGRVIAYADSVYLSDASFIVSEASRQRVLRERCKNVHAWVEGEIEVCELIELRQGDYNPLIGVPDHDHPVKVRYNPYIRGNFFYACNEQPIYQSRCAWVRPDGVFIE